MSIFKDIDIELKNYGYSAKRVDGALRKLFGKGIGVSGFKLSLNRPMVRIFMHRGGQTSYLNFLEKQQEVNIPEAKKNQLVSEHPAAIAIYEKLSKDQNDIRFVFKGILNRAHFEVMDADKTLLNLELLVGTEYSETTARIFQNIFYSKDANGKTPINAINFNIDVWVSVEKLLGELPQKDEIVFSVDDNLFIEEGTTESIEEDEWKTKLNNYNPDGTFALSQSELIRMTKEKKNQPYLL